jgi:hypothetical protein
MINIINRRVKYPSKKNIFMKLTECNPDLSCFNNYKNIVLSIDVDWAHDEIFADSIKLIESANVKATWFITHDTICLQKIRKNPLFEIGIHPNFNFLIEGDFRNGSNAKEVVERILKVAPESKCVRSHSITQSAKLLDLFNKYGITHESNYFIPYNLNMQLRPWILPNGICRVPFCWADDFHLSLGHEIDKFNQKSIVEKVNGLGVFDFHPIHIYLNTESLDRYEQTRPIHHNPEELIKHRYTGYGTRNRLMELLES